VRHLLVVLLLCGCAVTPKARLRVQAQSILGNCLNAGGDTRECLIQNAAWCRSQGLEASCGADEYWPKINRPPGPRAEEKKEDG
jgi:hypothetical protein